MFFDKIKKFVTRSPVPVSKKGAFQKYKQIRVELMSIVNKLEELKLAILNSTKDSEEARLQKEIDKLNLAKKTLEENIRLLEKNFYDIEQGLWIGIAYDLENPKDPPQLLYLSWKVLHKHFGVFGLTGYGKSRLLALMVRQFIHYGWSLLLVDPKGGPGQELAQWTYDFAAEANRNNSVVRIMPTYPHISDKFNILFGMGDDEIASMVSGLTLSGTGVVSSDEQFFSGQVYRTVNAILLAMRFLEAATYKKDEIVNLIRYEIEKYNKFKQQKNLNIRYEDEELRLPDISQLSIEEIHKNRDTIKVLNPYLRTLVTFRELSFYSSFNRLEELRDLVKKIPITTEIEGIEKAELTKLREAAILSLEEITTKDKAFFEKTGESLSVLLSQLSYGAIGDILCNFRINPLIKGIRSKEGIIVILQPAPMRFEKVSEMLMKCITRMFLSLFGEIGATGRAIDRRVAFIIDEAKPMMFPGIEEIYNKARQLGMTIGAFFQSRADIKVKMGDLLSDVLQDNTATTIFMKQESRSSCEEISVMFGKRKKTVNVQMNDIGGGGRSTVIYEEEELISPDDVASLGIGEAYIRHDGKKYFVQFPYQADPSNKIDVVMPEVESERLYKIIHKIDKKITEASKAFIPNEQIISKDMIK